MTKLTISGSQGAFWWQTPGSCSWMLVNAIVIPASNLITVDVPVQAVKPTLGGGLGVKRVNFSTERLRG